MKVDIWLRDDLAAEIASRGTNRSGIISRDLGRLYTLYARNLPRNLTEAEARLIVDCLNGALMTADTARLLWAEVEDGIKLEGLAEKYEVDGPVLVEKLKALDDIQALAVIDAAERFWQPMDETKRKIPELTVRELFRIRNGG